MALDVRVFVLAAAGALALVGIAVGAETQEETFLRPEALADGGLGETASNLVALTAFIPAIAVTLGAVVLSRQPALRRIAPGAGIFVTTYLIVGLIQSSWPNYDTLVELRQASFSITPLISNGAAVPSVFLGPMAILLAAALVLHRCLRALVPVREPDRRPAAVLRRYVEAYGLAVPFLVILALGNLRLLFALPDQQANTVPYLFVFPVGTLAAVGLIVTGGIKAWHLGAFVRNGRLADSVSDLWSAIRKAEWVLTGVLVGLAVLATILEPLPSDLLEAGRTFGVTTRGHAQAQMLLLLPLALWLGMDVAVQRCIESHAGHSATLDVRADPLVIGTWVALGIGAFGATVTTWSAQGALWPWAWALAPITLFAWRKFSPLGAAWPSLLLAVVLWGIGNTVVGFFRLTEDVGNNLVLEDAPGLLALFRFLAAIVAAVAVGRLARRHATELRPSLAWPLAGTIAIALALLLFIELSFAAWIAPQSQGEFVGIGSLVSSQDRAVAGTLHTLAGIVSFGAGMAVARIHRPDWFGRSGNASDMEQPLVDPYFHPRGDVPAPEHPPGESAH